LVAEVIVTGVEEDTTDPESMNVVFRRADPAV